MADHWLDNEHKAMCRSQYWAFLGAAFKYRKALAETPWRRWRRRCYLKDQIDMYENLAQRCPSDAFPTEPEIPK